MVLVLGITLLAAQTAAAFHTFVTPAGFGCAFDVLLESTHQEPPGDRFPIGYGDITFTNMDTGASYLQRSRYTETVTFDPETNTVLSEVRGRIWVNFFPGDQGPNGEVGYPGANLVFSGSVQLTIDADTGAYTAFSYQGEFIDVCAELSD
jgi:hypothetical protein